MRGMRRSAMSIFGRRTDDWESFTPESRATRKQSHNFPFADLGFHDSGQRASLRPTLLCRKWLATHGRVDGIEEPQAIDICRRANCDRIAEIQHLAIGIGERGPRVTPIRGQPHCQHDQSRCDPLGGLSSQRLTAAVSNISLTLGGSFASTATSTCKSPRCELGFPAIATLRWWRERCVGRSPPTQMLSNNESKAGQTTEADQSITNHNLSPQPALREPPPMISPGSDPPELGEAV
jgi:hypothetical protein